MTIEKNFRTSLSIRAREDTYWRGVRHWAQAKALILGCALAILSSPAIGSNAESGCESKDPVGGFQGSAIAMDEIIDGLKTNKPYVRSALESAAPTGSGNRDGSGIAGQGLLTLYRWVHVLKDAYKTDFDTLPKYSGSGAHYARLRDGMLAWKLIYDNPDQQRIVVDKKNVTLDDLANWPLVDTDGSVVLVPEQEDFEIQQAIRFFDKLLSATKAKKKLNVAEWKAELDRAYDMYDLLKQTLDQLPAQDVLLDPNGDRVHYPDGVNHTDWTLEQWAAGTPYILSCNNATANSNEDSSGGQKSGGSLNFSANRDTAVLKTFNLKDPLAGDPTLSLSPITVQGAVAYSFLSENQPYCVVDHCGSPYVISAFFDSFYGPDTRSPTTPHPNINRLGAGLNFAVRSPQLFGDVDAVFQFIPEFISDSEFESKAALVELRADVVGFRGLEDHPIPISCFGNDTAPFFDAWLQFSCGLAVIADGGHSFKDALNDPVHNDFARLGGEIGFGLTPLPVRCGGFICDNLLNQVSFKATYKNMWDYSGNGVNTHNFTAELDYKLPAALSGGSFKVQYIDGQEDLTLFKLKPKEWNFGFSFATN